MLDTPHCPPGGTELSSFWCQIGSIRAHHPLRLTPPHFVGVACARFYPTSPCRNTERLISAGRCAAEVRLKSPARQAREATRARAARPGRPAPDSDGTSVTARQAERTAGGDAKHEERPAVTRPAPQGVCRRTPIAIWCSTVEKCRRRHRRACAALDRLEAQRPRWFVVRNAHAARRHLVHIAKRLALGGARRAQK